MHAGYNIIKIRSLPLRSLVCLALSPSPLLVRPSLQRLIPPPHVFTLLHLCNSPFLLRPSPSAVDTFPLRRVVLVQDRWLPTIEGDGPGEKWPEEEDTDEDNCLIVNPPVPVHSFRESPRHASQQTGCSDFAFEFHREPERALPRDRSTGN